MTHRLIIVAGCVPKRYGEMPANTLATCVADSSRDRTILLEMALLWPAWRTLPESYSPLRASRTHLGTHTKELGCCLMMLRTGSSTGTLVATELGAVEASTVLLAQPGAVTHGTKARLGRAHRNVG
jgi:hypothetical protein